jgi:short-subunit dehydrogenase
MRSIAKRFISAVGTVDLVVANAGIREVEDENNQDLSISRRVMNVNFFGVLNTVSPFLLNFKEQNKGHIAVISSIAAYRGMPNSGIYSASKAALNIWFESLRLRMGGYLKITVISLSFVSTEMTAKLPFWMPGLLTPDEAATKIGKAILKKNRTVIIPWQSAIIWSLLNNMPNRLYDSFILFAKKYGPRKR